APTTPVRAELEQHVFVLTLRGRQCLGDLFPSISLGVVNRRADSLRLIGSKRRQNGRGYETERERQGFEQYVVFHNRVSYLTRRDHPAFKNLTASAKSAGR